MTMPRPLPRGDTALFNAFSKISFNNGWVVPFCQLMLLSVATTVAAVLKVSRMTMNLVLALPAAQTLQWCTLPLAIC